jgi:hypothetical protein
LIYNGQRIFEGTFESTDPGVQFREQVLEDSNALTQVVVLFTSQWNNTITLDGTIIGSVESFPCQADRPDRRGGGPPIVRHSSGLSQSKLNRAVYDRQSDWVLSVDANPDVELIPRKVSENRQVYSIRIVGREIVLRFRPRFYQIHRRLSFYEPWAFRIWPTSVAGWISWFAFYSKVTQEDITWTADVLSEVLLPFGYEYLQIDDGYQQARGEPSLWLKPNDKFPLGLAYLSDYIKTKGLKPGLWTAASIDQPDLVSRRPDWFVRDSLNSPVRGNWIGYPLDASNEEALDSLVRPLYRSLRGMGWEYFKVDALRHLRYEGYNANARYFDRVHRDRVIAFRRYVSAIREEIGPDRFLLGCWGIRPELIGLIDACRIGDDGFSYAGLAQYNSFNNVVWRNDPDHIELNEDAYRSTMVTSLTGSVLLLTDKPNVYRTAIVEPAKRAAPVLTTHPGQLYDVDPSRSSLLGRADSEVSGSGPRVFDAGYTPQCHLFLLEIVRPYERWAVLGRTGGSFSELQFGDLGLDPDAEYVVMEFWSKKVLGFFTEGFAPGPLDPLFRSQLFVIRQRRSHPQLVATSRHVTGGGYDLLDCRWQKGTLSGRSLLIKDDPYVLYVTEPEGYHYETFKCKGARLEKLERDGSFLRLNLGGHSDGEITWSITFTVK